MPLRAAPLLVRAPTLDDAAAVAALINACALAEYGGTDLTAQSLREEWRGCDLAADAWLVSAQDGQLAGYGEVFNHGQGRLNAYARVHPSQTGRGIGSFLLDLAEDRARAALPTAPPGARVVLTNTIASANQAARWLLEGRGYTVARQFWRMAMRMTEPPPPPLWPPGITTRRFVANQDTRAVFAAVEEAFTDHWDYAPEAFASWEQRMVRRAGFDSTLWTLACDGDEIAGACLCSYRLEMGWVNQLAVRRPWRRRGLGMALLRHAFGAFYRRGTRSVGLGVDAQSLTGATRLYERAGMRVERQYDRYQKELRPGKDADTSRQ